MRKYHTLRHLAFLFAESLLVPQIVKRQFENQIKSLFVLQTLNCKSKVEVLFLEFLESLSAYEAPNIRSIENIEALTHKMFKHFKKINKFAPR
jgi:hypothetical protein